MNLAAFDAFIKVMETKSISKAAERLFITQPAVSKRIQSLEQYLKLRLFEPNGRQIQPTPVAIRLLPQIKNWLNELQHIQNEMSQSLDLVQGKLKIGTSHHIGLHHLTPILRQFAQQYPDVELEVRFVDSEQAHQAVIQGDLELAFLTLPPHLDHRLHYMPLWKDQFMFVCSTFHPLVFKQKVSLEDLTHYPCLLPATHTFTSQITLKKFAEQGLKPHVSTTTNPLESIRMLVAVGLGWSVLPQILINAEITKLPIDLDLQRDLGLVWHPARTQSKAASVLVDFIQQSSSSADTASNIEPLDL